MDAERLRAIPTSSPMRLIVLTRWELKRAGRDALEPIRTTIEQRRPVDG